MRGESSAQLDLSALGALQQLQELHVLPCGAGNENFSRVILPVAGGGAWHRLRVLLLPFSCGLDAAACLALSATTALEELHAGFIVHDAQRPARLHVPSLAELNLQHMQPSDLPSLAHINVPAAAVSVTINVDDGSPSAAASCSALLLSLADLAPPRVARVAYMHFSVSRRASWDSLVEALPSCTDHALVLSVSNRSAVTDADVVRLLRAPMLRLERLMLWRMDNVAAVAVGICARAVAGLPPLALSLYGATGFTKPAAELRSLLRAAGMVRYMVNGELT